MLRSLWAQQKSDAMGTGGGTSNSSGKYDAYVCTPERKELAELILVAKRKSGDVADAAAAKRSRAYAAAAESVELERAMKQELHGYAIQREQLAIEREQLAIEREQIAINREKAALEREKAAGIAASKIAKMKIKLVAKANNSDSNTSGSESVGGFDDVDHQGYPNSKNNSPDAIL